ncbi:phosphohydrolase [Aureimonas endophytica]|uniref:Phosphohydrolase n=1 Tax=Aureimonas endophytica TaxID=2027858 RepID=A0A916ZQ06_9HYPH|nr:metallophosphoesterase [Aureimonas endophytica]GGE05816.1 phosphohydrolase [Aureimonas endophytica]
MPKIAVIADPHIGVEKPHFVGNWHRAVAEANARAPDLTVILGDLTFDGAHSEADCAFAREALAALATPWLAVPGNHDVGDTDRGSGKASDPARLARWRRHFGPDFWLSDLDGGWRLVGIDSQILGTGLAAETEQWAFLEEALTGGRRVLLFTHQPLFLKNWDEADRLYWASCGAARRRLRDLFRSADVAAVVSGHMHRAFVSLPKAGPSFVWTPATSFLTRDASMPPQGGTAMTGITLLDLSETGVAVGFHPIPDLETFFIEDFNGTLYPAPAR